MTNSFLAECDAICREAFKDVSTADRAQYDDGSGPLVDCDIYVDRTVVRRDESGVEFIEDGVGVKAFRDQIAARPRRDTSSFVVGAERFVVKRIDEYDESLWICICQPQA